MSDAYPQYSPGPLQDDNMGGLCEMRYAQVDWVLACPPPVQNTCTTDLTFDPSIGAAAWNTLPITLDSADFQEDSSMGPNGVEYRVRFTAVVAKVQQGTLQVVQQQGRHRHIIEVQDNNGLWRRIGDLRNPCRISIGESLGAQASARNAFTITATWTNDEPAPFVDTSYTPYFGHLEDDTSGSGGGGGGGT